MPTPKQEFQRLRNEINESATAHILFYKNKDKFRDPTELAYTYYTENPPTIVLRKGKEISYRYLIQNLLHEYAHILDYKKQTKRFSTFMLYDISYADINKAPLVSARIKRAVLETEYIAEKSVKTLLKRFKVNLGDNQYTDKELKSEAVRVVLANKYEMKYGKAPNKKKYKELATIAKKRWNMTKKELFNLNSI